LLALGVCGGLGGEGVGNRLDMDIIATEYRGLVEWSFVWMLGCRWLWRCDDGLCEVEVCLDRVGVCAVVSASVGKGGELLDSLSVCFTKSMPLLLRGRC
jgi:hypothetical protein